MIYPRQQTCPHSSRRFMLLLPMLFLVLGSLFSQSGWGGKLAASDPDELPVTTAPTNVCLGDLVNVSATASAGSIDWYDALTGGNLLGNTALGANFPVTLTNPIVAYAKINPNITQNFVYTGGVQTFTVPAGITSLSITAKGASGAYDLASLAGRGGKVVAVLSVTPGQTLSIHVGGAGSGCNGGFNGGGTGGWCGAINTRGGGGATDIRIGGTALANRVLVAGGGGGAKDVKAGGGGGLVGQDAVPLGTNGSFYIGHGGTQTAGGAGYYSGPPASIGSLGNGGGGDGTGGGGGYYGGGGGYFGVFPIQILGGGGGSSYTDPTLCSSVTHIQNDNLGHGSLAISWTVAGSFSPLRVPATATLKTGSVLSMAVSNVGVCSSGGTTCTSDDTFTADVTVTYNSKPATGTLALSGADIVGTAPSIDVASAGATQQTFTGVLLRADGAAIGLTALFSAANTCPLTISNLGTAPAACSSATCNVSGLSASVFSDCNGNGTVSEDYFTTNVTVNFAYAPGTGNLTLKRGSTILATKLASQLACLTSWTFSNVHSAANGAAVYLTAEFSNTCSFTSASLGLAPASCSCVIPAAWSVTGGGASCAGESLPIGLSGSATGVTYQLVRNPSTNVGSPVSGTGSAIAFVPQITPGTYSVVATQTEGNCTANMTGNVDVFATDNIPPVILNCVTTIVYATLNTLCKITIPNFTTTILATDNCSGTLTKTQSPAAGTQYATTHNQNFPVVISVTDAAGNTSTCTRTVRAKDATKPPIYTCPPSQVVALNASCQLIVPDKTGQLISTDGCSNPVAKTQFPTLDTPLLSAPGMTHTLTFTATDGAGNTRTCTAILTGGPTCGSMLVGHPDRSGETEAEKEPVFIEKTMENNPDLAIKPVSIQTMPNPFSDELTIAFDLDEAAQTKVVLMDLTGKFQFFEKENWLEKGRQKVVWNTEDLPGGAYFVGLKTESTGWIWRKVVLVR